MSQATEVNRTWDDLWKENPSCRPVDTEHDSISILTRTLIENLSCNQMTFLDVGSGPGSRSVPIVGSKEGVQLILLDQSRTALELAQQNTNESISAQYVQADGFQLPFPDRSITCVFANGVNEHFLDPERQQLIDEMTRVVKPNGYIALMVPNKLNPFHTASKIISEKRGSWKFGPQYDFTPNELQQRMADAGLEDIKSFGVGAFTSWIRILPHERQGKYYQSPTPFKELNNILWRLDAQTSSSINRNFGREILVLARKPQ